VLLDGGDRGERRVALVLEVVDDRSVGVDPEHEGVGHRLRVQGLGQAPNDRAGEGGRQGRVEGRVPRVREGDPVDAVRAPRDSVREAGQVLDQDVVGPRLRAFEPAAQHAVLARLADEEEVAARRDGHAVGEAQVRQHVVELARLGVVAEHAPVGGVLHEVVFVDGDPELPARVGEVDGPVGGHVHVVAEAQLQATHVAGHEGGGPVESDAEEAVVGVAGPEGAVGREVEAQNAAPLRGLAEDLGDAVRDSDDGAVVEPAVEPPLGVDGHVLGALAQGRGGVVRHRRQGLVDGPGGRRRRRPGLRVDGDRPEEQVTGESAQQQRPRQLGPGAEGLVRWLGGVVAHGRSVRDRGRASTRSAGALPTRSPGLRAP
jgi:hypothetical protein